VLWEIRSGRKKRIRARTERLILAVTSAVASDHAYISAARTHQLIAELLDEGYTEAFLCQRLGYANRYLQFGDRITARNAYRVARLHKELTE
jgi:AraC-like DNA-binding protein